MSWDVLKANQRQMFASGVALCGVALLAAVSSFWVRDMRWMSTVLLLLGMHAFTVAHACKRMADLQAALDMKKFALDMTKKGPLGVVEETVRLGGPPVALRARDQSQFRVYLQGIAPEGCALKIEYLG